MQSYSPTHLELTVFQTPDPKRMQINLTGFLTTSTSTFMTALWSLLLDAQDSPAGIPHGFEEEKD